MERIKGKEVKSLMEAYASIYKNEEVQQEVISEETQELDEGIADDPRSGVLGQAERLRRKMFGTASERNQAVSYERSIDALTKSRGGGNVRLGKDGKPITADQIAAETKRRRLADPNYKPGQGVDSGAKPNSGGTPEVLADRKPKPKPQSSASNLKPGSPNVVVSPKSGEQTKFERRLPTMAELRAAQAARAAAKAGGASPKEAEYQAVKAGVGVSKGTVKDPKIAADAARKAELEAIRAKAKAETMKKSRLGEETELDIFDTIKQYLIDEGATEEEALKKMLTLTVEEREAIIEGSCGGSHSGGKKKKKSKKGGY